MKQKKLDKVRHDIVGFGGMGGKGGGGGGIVEAKDSIRSRQIASLIDIISEGPISGIVGGLEGIFFNETPVLNHDGSPNFYNMRADWRVGTPDQAPVPGFNGVESEVSVSVMVRADMPVTRSITNPDVDTVRVTVAVSGLTTQDTKTGDIKGARVDYEIWLQCNGGGYKRSVAAAFDAKTTSRTQRAHLIQVPRGSGPWDVRVIRVTPDNSASNINDKLYWDSFTQIISDQLIYPNSAYVAERVDSSQFNSIPSRAYHIKGLIIQVPSNYNPETRAYAGTWDGSFKPAYSNNPAWCFYDLIVNDRYGLGEHIRPEMMDKWALYQIAQYCDELVPNAAGGMEPRFTCNLYLQTQEEALTVLQNMASIFRAIVFWSGGTVVANQDRVKLPVAQFTNANIESGKFVYSDSSARQRATVVMVTWNDPANMYRQTIELVQDDDSVKRYGIIKREVVAFGCTSRGQARRYGKWLLLTERYENETITFTTGLEGCEAFPGAVIETSDAFRAGARFGGRLAAATATELTLDSELTLAVGHTHWISVVRPSDGLTVRAAITNPPGTYTTIAVPDLGFVPDKDSVWLSGGSDVTPEMWRIMGAREAGKNRVEITALQYNPSKFDAADRDAPMEVPTTSTIKTVPDTPTNLQFIAARYVVEGTMVGIRGTLSWTGTAQSYDVRYRRASGSWETRTVTQATMDINNIAIDVYTFEVIARNILCRSSTPASLVVSVNPGPIALPDVTGLVLDGAFTSNALKFKWNGVPGATSYEVRLTANASGLVAKRVKVGDSLHYTWTAAEMRQAGGPWRSVKVEVRALGALGAESAWATVLASNPQVGAMGSIQVDGGIKAIYVQATKPDDGDFAGMIVWAGATPGFVVNDASKVYDGVDTFVTINKIAGQQLDTGTYYVRIAGYDDFGKDSLTVSSAIAANVQSAVPGPNSITELMIQNGALTVAKFAQGIEPVGTVATLPSTAGYTGPKVVLNTTDGKLYRLVNNTWTRAVDGTDLSGGTVDATKFASGIEPVGLVTTLPNPSGYTGPKVVLNQTDGKTYRLVGGAWKKDVDAADIAGQLQAGQIASGAVDATKFASGIEPVTNVTTVPSVKSTSTVFNTTDGKLYRWNGTSYVATVPATDVSGQIAAAQIAAGAVDATKMASGIEPVSIVSKLPTTKSTTTIVNSADGKLYRWNGTAYVSTVDAVDVTGQITAAQLASGAVTTAKFAAGIEPVATVTGVPATKQTSTVFNTVDNKLYRWNGSAYVATVPTTDLTGQISAGQLAPGVVDSTKFANGVEPVTLVTVVPTTKSTSTVFNTVDGKLYRWNGTAYIATVPTVDLSGLISTAQIAAGAIDSTKLASGLEAVTIVSKLPTVKSTSNVFNTADSKLYRWNGSAYVASVAATDIAGQITADQIAAGTVDQTKFASDIEAVSLVSALPTKKSTNTVFNTADNKLYRWNGTAYVSTVAATDITGTLASAQIAAGAVDATKLASGIEPITVVTAVPGTKSTTTIYNSTDGKLYRWTTSGYVSSVPATDITGQLQAAQIAVGAIDTTKLASGIEPVTVVTTIPSTKKTSAVFNSTDGKLYSWTGTKYVCTVDATDISGQISASQIAAGVIDATKLAAGIEPVAVVSGLPGTKKTSTVFNSLDNKLYRWDGTRYVSTVDAVDITGQLTAAQLANGAVDATKFASGIEPVTNVATVPSTKSTSTIYNTTDKKIYRWNGSAYVASVAATDVSGQISEAQVAAGAIDSTKLASGIEAVSIVSTLPSSAGYTGPKTVFNTADGKLYRYFAGGWVSTVNTADLDGTISSAQIAGIAASKVTGQLTDAQVAAVAAAKITGTIGATQISDGAISTPKLAAGAVTAAQIAANTITASQLAAGAVTATTLSAGAVTTAKIAAGAVTATELAAGSVTAAKVAANAVTAGAIAADAVTAGTIAAAAITSREVAANAITTDKILVGNFSNLIPNGDLETGTLANWRPYAGPTSVIASSDPAVPVGAPTPYVLRFSSSAGGRSAIFAHAKVHNDVGSDQDGIALTPGEQYVTRFYIARSADALLGTGTMVRIYYHKADGTTANSISLKTFAGGVSGIPTAWTEVVATWTVPADATRGYLYFNFDTGFTTGDIFITRVRTTRVSDTTLIADGAITTQKIVAGAVTANEVAANAITADKIAANAVTAGSVAAGAISTRELAAGAVTANELAAKSVIAGKIAAGAVTATELSANAVTAGKIASNAVTAGTIAAGAITATELSAGAVTTAKLAAGAVSATQLASNAVTTDKLAAGAVTATELAAGAVTAGKLAASAVTAGTIAAGAVSATELAANAVTTAKLAAGAVTANELAANSVVAAKIAAGSVSAIALAANSVTAGKIAADAVTAGTVAAGAVSTRELAAGSITATKLALGDTSNLYPDASFSDLSFYSSANGTFRFGTTGTTVATAILMLVDVSATDAVEVFSKDFAMEPSKPYFFSGIVRRTLTANQSQPSMAVEWLSGSPGAAPVVISRQVFATNDPSNRSTFRQTAILTAPANARAARLVFITTAAPDGSSSLFVEPIIRRAANGELIVDGSITTQKLVANAVTTNELAASAVTATQLAAGAVTAGKLSANAVTAGTIAAGAVSATELAANAVTTAKLAAGAVTTVQLAAGSVTTANLTAGAVTANELSAGAVTAGKIAANAVTAGTIAAGAVTTTQLAANAVTSVTIAASAVTATELAAGSVVTNKIAAGAVTANELAANSVTAGKVAANAVTAGTIAANAVTTGTIAAGAVTASQIAAGAITAAQMAANSVTAVQLAAGAVTATSIAANAVTAGKIATDAVTAGTVAANAISAREIAAGAITAQKLAIGDFENLVPGATFANGLAGWTAYGSSGSTVQPYAGAEGLGLRLTKDASTIEIGARLEGWPNTHPVAVTPGEQWRVSCTVTRKAGTSGGNIGVFGHFQLQDGSGAGSAIAGTTSATSVIGAQVDVSGLFTVPDNAVAASFQIYYGSNASSANGDVVVTNIAVRRVVGSTVIADGAITTDKLLAGAVTANALAANAVTAGKIAANAVTAGTVVAGAISATELAAGAVTTAKIAAGAVTATSIATYAVTTAKIAAGAVTANEIAANAVTANALAANAVTAGTVAAGAIGANEIAAGAIRAQHLLIAPKSLNTDPSFEGGLARWSGFVRRLPSTDPAVPVDCPVTYASEFSGRDNVPTIRMSVQPGEVYKVSCWVNRGKGSGGAGIGLVGIEYDGTGARVAGYSMGATTAAGWQLVSVARTIGSSTTQVQFGVWADRTTYQGEAWYSELNIERVNDASLIVDGTITAAKLMAGSVTAGKIAANAVTAGNIAANAVTAGTVAAGAISTTELAAGAITTAKLGAKAVTTAALAAGAVTANELAANSVTADKLVANAVTAGTIAAGAVSSREIAAGAVTTDKLVVGNFDNLIPNGEFATGDLTNWRPWAGATSVVASTNAAVPAGATSSNVLRLDGVAGARSSLFSHTKTYSDVGGETDGIPVVAGQQYLVEFNVARTAAIAAGTTFFVRFYFRRKDGTGAAGPIITNLTTVASIPTAWSPISGTITIPSTTPDVERMYLYISAETSFTSGSIFVERVRCTRVSDATLIADGSIITQKLVTASVSSDKIATNAVTADKIVANAITGDKIAANAITAAKIAAGSISADHLMVGQSANMLVNPGFESDWYGWSNPTIYGTTDWGMNLAAAGAVLANTSNKTVYIKQTGGAGSSSQNAQLTQTLPCEAGKTYMATVYSGARRCNVWVVARFLNDAGQNVATTAEAGDNYNRQEAAGSSSLASYKRVWYRAKAPAGATKVSFIIVKESTVTGQADSYAFLARPYLGEVAPNQTDAPAWDAAGATVIGPGNISTGSLSAISANLGYIAAGQLDLYGAGNYMRSNQKSWADGRQGFISFGDGSASTYLDVVGGSSRMWMSSWGDCGISFPNFRVDNYGNLYCRGDIQANSLTANIVNTPHMVSRSVSDMAYLSAGNDLYFSVSDNCLVMWGATTTGGISLIGPSGNIMDISTGVLANGGDKASAAGCAAIGPGSYRVRAPSPAISLFALWFKR